MNRVVSLGWEKNEVRGMVDSAPTQLTWTEFGDGYQIRGLYGGKLSNLRVTSSGIEGNIGDCGYSMQADRSAYRGRAMCLTGMNMNAEVTLPSDLSSRSAGEQVTLMALILSGGPERSQRDLAFTAEAASPGVDYYHAPGMGSQPSWVQVPRNVDTKTPSDVR